MSEMIDRVAKAIMRRAAETAETDESEQWLAEQFARAALEALRDPPQEIRIIATMQGWNAAIDAALERGE